MADNQYNNPSQANQTEEQPSLQLSDLWELVWNHKWWYVFSVLAALFIAGFYLYKTPKVYSRTEKVIVDEDSQNAMMRDLTSFSGSYRRYSQGTNVDNEIEAFTSPDLMERVVSRLGLEVQYVDDQFLRVREMYKNTPVEMHVLENSSSSFSFILSKTGKESFQLKDIRIAGRELEGEKIEGVLGDTLTTSFGKLLFTPTSYIDSWGHNILISWVNAKARGKAYCSRLSASLSSKQSSVMVLSFKDVFPGRAESVLSTLLDIYNEDWMNLKNTSARNTSVFINERLNVIEHELGGIEGELKAYKQQHQITDAESAAQAILQQSSAYSAQSFETSKRLEIAQYIKNWINDPAHSNDLIPVNMGMQSPNVEAQIADYNKAYLERDRLLALSSDSNPLVQDLNVTLEAYKVAINRSIDNLISTLNLEVNKIKAQEREILGRLTSTSGEQLELLGIERQQMVKQQLYIFLLQKREENELQSLLTVGNTRLIQKPTGGSSPIAPNKMMILLVALILGFGIPFAVFYIMKIMDNSVKGRSDLSRLSVPFLAEIPQLGLEGNYWQKLRANKYDEKHTRILVQSGKRDMINEAFRVLRTNLDLMMHSQEGESKVIMLTSFNPNAGKTFTVLNLAASMALKNSKVILVDLDLRKATLSKWLRTAWDLIGPEYKRYRQLGIEKVMELKKLESYPHIITHVGDDGIVLTLEYKGETGTVEYSDKDYMYFGRIGTHLYEGVDLPELIDSFRGVVDRHYSGELEIGCAADEEFF